MTCMNKRSLLVLVSILFFAFSSGAQIMNCGNFCVLSITNVDSVSMDVTIYNGDTNHVNYPTIVIVDALGDTIANKDNYFYFFAHPAGDTLTQTIPSEVDSVPSGFTGTVYLTDQVWDTTCAFSFPMSCTVGINEYASISGLSIYPNPASDVINIRLPKHKNPAAEISLFDMTGRKSKTVITAE